MTFKELEALTSLIGRASFMLFLACCAVLILREPEPPRKNDKKGHRDLDEL
jgi:hypothetical protein